MLTKDSLYILKKEITITVFSKKYLKHNKLFRDSNCAKQVSPD